MESDTKELSAYVKAYTSELLAYTLTRISDRSTAEDLVQDTFLAAAEAYGRFEKRSSPKTWLFSILKNKIADYYRLQYKQISYQFVANTDTLFDENAWLKAPCSSVRWSMNEELLDDEDFLLALKSCLDKLPEKWSSVVALKYLYGNDGTTVCQKLEITASNFWQIMHRAKLQLKTCLENKWFKVPAEV